jgi:hypothetical protein
MKCLLPAPPWPERQKMRIWSTKFDFSNMIAACEVKGKIKK